MDCIAYTIGTFGTLYSLLIGVPIFVQWVIGEPHTVDTERARKCVVRNISTLALPAGLYMKFLLREDLLDFGELKIQDMFSYFILLFFMDTWFYWWHRALHTWPLLYEFHREHHSFRPTTTMSYVAMSLLEFYLENVIYYAVPPLIWYRKLHVAPWMGANLTLLIWATIFHSNNAQFSTGKFGINGPYEHQAHHRFGLKNGNFGLLFTFWDVMMKTQICNSLKMR